TRHSMSDDEGQYSWPRLPYRSTRPGSAALGEGIGQLLHELRIAIWPERHLLTHLVQQQHLGTGIAGDRLDHCRRELRLGIDATRLFLLQRLADIDQRLGARATRRAHGKVPLGADAVVTFPVTIGLVKHEIALLAHR